MPTKTFPFDISEHLETDEDIREFLKEVANSGNFHNYYD
jgi:DNA-binding phage protein